MPSLRAKELTIAEQHSIAWCVCVWEYKRSMCVYTWALRGLFAWVRQEALIIDNFDVDENLIFKN